MATQYRSTQTMRRILELFLISAMVLGSALEAQEDNAVRVLVLDVYSINVPSDVIHEKGSPPVAGAILGTVFSRLSEEARAA
jgi:hypothetical protein